MWNEAGQLVASIDNVSCGYYGYDGNGNRAYKLTGQSVQDQHNAGEWQYHVDFNDAVLYVNPYFIVTPKGYTRHYYNALRTGSANVPTWGFSKIASNFQVNLHEWELMIRT